MPFLKVLAAGLCCLLLLVACSSDGSAPSRERVPAVDRERAVSGLDGDDAEGGPTTTGDGDAVPPSPSDAGVVSGPSPGPSSPSPSPVRRGVRGAGSCPGEPPGDVTPDWLGTRFEAEASSYRRGEEIRGEFVITNRSTERQFYHESRWVMALTTSEGIVGGFDNYAGWHDGARRRVLLPLESHRYPRDSTGIGGWGGYVDSLSCRRHADDARVPLPAGDYELLIVFPVGEEFEIAAEVRGAHAWAPIRIVD